MAHNHARVDTLRQFKSGGSIRKVPVTVNSEAAIAIFDEEAFEGLSDMVTTIQRKIPNYTYILAVERATKRALEDGLFCDGVVKITPGHI
jgi:hypothetical protein